MTNEITLQRPTARVEAIIKAMQHPHNWKLPTSTFTTNIRSRAEDVAAGLEFYMGGSETRENGDGSFTVSSRGYYHYIGA